MDVVRSFMTPCCKICPSVSKPMWFVVVVKFCVCLPRPTVTDLACVSELFPTKSVKFSETVRSEEHTSELQSRGHLVCRLLLEKKKINKMKRLILYLSHI